MCVCVRVCVRLLVFGVSCAVVLLSLVLLIVVFPKNICTRHGLQIPCQVNVHSNGHNNTDVATVLQF